MSAPETPPPDPLTVRCPTCRASQEWSDTCRRCRSDLRLLRSCATTYAQARRDCLLHLQAGRLAAAGHLAGRCHALAPSTETRRLVAITALRRQDWPVAAGLGRPGPDR